MTKLLDWLIHEKVGDLINIRDVFQNTKHNASIHFILLMCYKLLDVWNIQFTSHYKAFYIL